MGEKGFRGPFWLGPLTHVVLLCRKQAFVSCLVSGSTERVARQVGCL